MSVHVVTGGAGFVGSNIARMLVERGETVRVVDIWKPSQPDSRIDYHICDINDAKKLSLIFRGADYIHHNVALVPLTKAGKDFDKVNVQGTKTMLDVAEREKIKFVSHMSSSAIFGSPDIMPITNETPLCPIEIYGQSKAQADLLIQQELGKGRNVASVRPRTIVGTERLGIFEILFDWIKDNANIYLIGKGTYPFQFVHVDDLCEVSIQACLQQKPGLYNVGSAEFGSLREDLGALIDHAGSKSKIKSLPTGITINTLKTLDYLKLSPLAPWHYLTYHKPFHFDIKHVEDSLGWKPKYSNKQILQIAYDWFVNEYEKKPIVQQDGMTSIHKKSVKQGVLRLLKAIS